MDYKDNNYKASYSQLGELLPIFEFLLTYFKSLEKQVKASNFNNCPGISHLITLTWSRVKDYYSKTDKLVA